MLGCRCTEMQLDLVGCDCGADEYPIMIAEVFRDGYASDNKARFEFFPTPWFDADDYARQEYGSFARIYSKRRKYPEPAGFTVTEAQARAMSKNDNS